MKKSRSDRHLSKVTKMSSLFSFILHSPDLVCQLSCCSGVPTVQLSWCANCTAVLVRQLYCCSGVPTVLLFWCANCTAVLVRQLYCCSGAPTVPLFWCANCLVYQCTVYCCSGAPTTCANRTAVLKGRQLYCCSGAPTALLFWCPNSTGVLVCQRYYCSVCHPSCCVPTVLRF
jgi:hypothetical protein